MAYSKTVLITGCSTGIGRSTAEHLAARGWTVWATARRPESIRDLATRGCKTLALDVCDEASMRAAVETIERAVEGKRERPEERDAQPEEMKRRLIFRTPQPHGSANQKGHQPHGSQHEVHRAAMGHERQRHRHRLTRAEPRQRVRKTRPFSPVALIRLHLVTPLDRRAVDGKDHVTALDAGGCRRRSRRDFDCGDTFGAVRPEDAVFDLM